MQSIRTSKFQTSWMLLGFISHLFQWTYCAFSFSPNRDFLYTANRAPTHYLEPCTTWSPNRPNSIFKSISGYLLERHNSKPSACLPRISPGCFGMVSTFIWKWTEGSLQPHYCHISRRHLQGGNDPERIRKPKGLLWLLARHPLCWVRGMWRHYCNLSSLLLAFSQRRRQKSAQITDPVWKSGRIRREGVVPVCCRLLSWSRGNYDFQSTHKDLRIRETMESAMREFSSISLADKRTDIDGKIYCCSPRPEIPRLESRTCYSGRFLWSFFSHTSLPRKSLSTLCRYSGFLLHTL